MLLPIEYASIKSLLPFGESWLLVDRVLEWEPGKRIVTEKYLDRDDPILTAHLSVEPRIFPGVLLIELIGQSAYLLSVLSRNEPRDEIPVLARCRARFLSPAFAGDQLKATVTIFGTIKGVSVAEGNVCTQDREVCRVQLMGSTVRCYDKGFISRR